MRDKKIILTIVGVLTLSVLVLIGLTKLPLGGEGSYPKGGRDTVAEFGDRRFVILSGKYHGVMKWNLYDRKNYKSIDDGITDYHEEGEYVYTYGEKGYTKLNFVTGEYLQSESLNDFTGEDCDILNGLKKEK